MFDQYVQTVEIGTLLQRRKHAIFIVVGAGGLATGQRTVERRRSHATFSFPCASAIGRRCGKGAVWRCGDAALSTVF